MKHYRIMPKQYIGERFVIDFYDYTKKEAIQKYRAKFPQFTLKELSINKN
jgi:hypothetical protein